MPTAPDPAAQAALDELAALSPEDRAAVEKMAEPPPAPIGEGAQVTVKVAYPVDSFDTGIDGVGILTRQPKQIPQTALAAVLAAARTCQVTIIQTEEK